MNGRACILCCQNIEAEVREALRTPDFEGVEVIVYDRHSGDAGKKRLSEQKAFGLHGKDCTHLLVLGCGCIYQPTIPYSESVRTTYMESGPSLFLPPEMVEYEAARGSYMVTPGWLKGWREHLHESKDCLETMLLETINEVVLLDTGLSLDSHTDLESFAAHLGMPSRRLPVGIHYLRLLLQSRMCEWRCEVHDSIISEAENAKRRAADYAMVFDLLGDMTVIRDEGELLENVIMVYQLLFSPKDVRYIPLGLEEGDVIEKAGVPGVYLQQMGRHHKGALKHPDKDGFLQLVTYNDEMIGALVVERLSFPQYLREYIDTSNFIADILSLAILNARTYRRLNNTIDALESEVNERMSAEHKLETANNKLNLLSRITRHDTLNQITVVKGYLDLMSGCMEQERFQTYVERMDKAVDCMMELIEFARGYEMIGMEAAEWICIDDMVDDLRPEGLTIDNRCPGVRIFSDRLLDKVFYNLLDNTVRHSGGATRVTISCQQEGGYLMLRWQDDGVGVPAEEKERIFERGVGKNTGYGLFIVREILHITGISIVEDGVLGQGARFSMTIPEGHYRLCDEKD